LLVAVAELGPVQREPVAVAVQAVLLLETQRQLFSLIRLLSVLAVLAGLVRGRLAPMAACRRF
jgi:hypothetical protein